MKMTREEYEGVIACIELLMDAAPGTAEATELMTLAFAAGEYEEVHFPEERAA